MSKEGRIRGNLHLTMDGDRDRDPHWSTGLSPQGPNEEQKEGEHEKGSQDREGCVHPLIQGDWSGGSSPGPAGLELKERVIGSDSLNVADMGVDWEAIDNGAGSWSACTGFLGSWSDWMLTFLDLEGAGRK